MEIIDNASKILRDVLAAEIHEGIKQSIAADMHIGLIEL